MDIKVFLKHRRKNEHSKIRFGVIEVSRIFVELMHVARSFRCEICGTFWRVDSEDKYQQGFVWKVGEYREDWATVNLIEEEKKLLLQTRGGNTDEKCVWTGCEKKKVKGMAYCIDHLYATGARR